MFPFSFKELLQSITCTKEATVKFIQTNSILKPSINCPGPLVDGRWVYGCGKPMQLKSTNGSKDGYVWRCHKVHKIMKNSITYTVKDVKLSIRHHSWLVDTKLELQIVLELIYLWSQGFSQNEIIHELKISNKTVTEWTNFLRESCIYSVMEKSSSICGNGIKVEIDESKFGKCEYH